MALKASIYKVHINLSDTDRHYYHDFNLTLALHPSETEERMMIRLLAFCCNAHEQLAFTRGLSSIDEPDLWLKSDDGRILAWIEVGQPAPERLKKASGQSESVQVFAYGRGLDIWWRQQAQALQALPKLHMRYIDAIESKALADLAQRNMNLSIMLSEGMAYISTESAQVTVALRAMPEPGSHF